MATDGTRHAPTTEAELAQAFQDLAKGESTASAMESQLTSLEQKIDDLLASVDGNVPHRHGEQAEDTDVGRSNHDDNRHSSA